MALIISNTGNSAFRSENLEGIFHILDKSYRKTNKIALHFKSGARVILRCKDAKEATEFINKLIDTIKNDETH